VEERNDPPTMARAHSPARRATTGRALITLLVAGGLAFTPLPASADPEPTDSREAAALVADRSRQLEIVSEKVNEARERLRIQRAAAEQAEADLAAAEESLGDAQAKVRTVARSAWTGSQAGTLEIMLSSTSPEELLHRVGTLDTIARYNGGVLTAASSASAAANEAQAAAARAAEEARSLVRRVAAQQESLDQQVAEYKDDYRRLAAQERAAREAAERAAREAAERAAREAADRERASRAERPATTAPAPATAPAPTRRAPSTPSASVSGSGNAGTAVATALAQVGDPYSWGASGPNAFDCSGLVQYAWAAAGVSLPHSSRMQSTMGSAVSRSALQPGDLLFFYSPVSHVGMYVGNGKMVHASTYGVPVKVASIDSMPSYSHARRIG
jgi:peptidoglycan DL-endopeptidase CwlO